MTNPHPGLRSHSRKRKSGKVVVYYYFDRRADGMPDQALGTDFDLAVKRWAAIMNRGSRVGGLIEEAFERWEAEVLPTYTSAETRKGYAKNLKRLRPVFGRSTWAQVELADLKHYLKLRKGKTQANREMSVFSIIWNWARGERLTKLPWPASGMERSKWKNKEKPRLVHWTDERFELIYNEGDQVLRDCMDLASATGLRLTDCRSILLPAKGNDLNLEGANKTGKQADYDAHTSAVVPPIVARRRLISADHLMLLSTEDGRAITPGMLRYRWDEARLHAALKAYLADDDDTARWIKARYLRDMRKMAAQRSPSIKDAANLLQHDDEALTKRHYAGVPTLRMVR